MNTNPETMTNAELADAIYSLQAIQKKNKIDSPVWLAASDHLQPMFKEAARRQSNGDTVRCIANEL